MTTWTYDWPTLTRRSGDGSVEPIPEETVASAGYVTKARRKPCPGCRTVPVERWLGIRWYGRPWPKRWRREGLRLRYEKAPGCGCIVKIKNLRYLAVRIRSAIGWYLHA